MTVDEVYTVVILTVMSGGYLVPAVVSGLRHRATSRWIRRQGHPTFVGLVPIVEHQRSRSSVAIGLGGLVGLGVALVALHLTVSPVPLSVHPWLLVGGTITGSGLSLGGLALLRATRRPVSPVRVAHTQAVGLDHYLSRGPLIATRVAAAAAVVASVTSAIAPVWSGTGLGPGVAWAALGAIVVGWAGTELVARRLVAQPQPAGSSLELVWRDALRAEILRDLFATPAVLALAATGAAALPAQYGGGGPAWVDVAVIGLLVLMAAVYATLLGTAALMVLGRLPHRPTLSRTTAGGPVR